MVRMTAGATGGVKQVLSPFDIAVGKGRRRRNYQDGCGQTNQPALMKHGFRDYFFLPEGLMASAASILRHRLILCTEGLHIAAFADSIWKVMTNFLNSPGFAQIYPFARVSPKSEPLGKTWAATFARSAIARAWIIKPPGYLAWPLRIPPMAPMWPPMAFITALRYFIAPSSWATAGTAISPKIANTRAAAMRMGLLRIFPLDVLIFVHRSVPGVPYGAQSAFREVLLRLGSGFTKARISRCLPIHCP